MTTVQCERCGDGHWVLSPLGEGRRVAVPCPDCNARGVAAYPGEAHRQRLARILRMATGDQDG